MTEQERIERAIDHLENMSHCGYLPMREKLERMNPQPLTLDELRGMDGEPVWIRILRSMGEISDGWFLVSACEYCFRLSNAEEYEIYPGDETEGGEYGVDYIAYRTKPEGIAE